MSARIRVACGAMLGVGLLVFTAIGAAWAAAPAEPADTSGIDWHRVRALFKKSQRDAQLTPDERSYLQRAKQALQKRPGASGAPAPGAPREIDRIIDFDSAPLPQVQVPAPRPRIWFTAQDVPILRRRCAGSPCRHRRRADSTHSDRAGRAPADEPAAYAESRMGGAGPRGV
jgi:hypothetical protein